MDGGGDGYWRRMIYVSPYRFLESVNSFKVGNSELYGVEPDEVDALFAAYTGAAPDTLDAPPGTS